MFLNKPELLVKVITVGLKNVSFIELENYPIFLLLSIKYMTGLFLVV
jgi:hypothetical protein